MFCNPSSLNDKYKMKIHFITYSDVKFKESARRLCRQAKSFDIFDSIQRYSPKDLPASLRSMPVFNFSRGGGYWLWKPYVILNKLNVIKEDDILCYSDAGSILYPTQEWSEFIDYLKSYDALFFQYRDKQYQWGRPTLKYWIKQSAVDYFQSQFEDLDWLEKPKFWAGFMLIKKNKV